MTPDTDSPRWLAPLLRWLRPAVGLLALAWVLVAARAVQRFELLESWRFTGQLLCLIGIVLALLGAPEARVRLRQRALALLLLAGVAVSVLGSGDNLEALGSRKQIQVWGAYHYYLGAKYFDELGYDGLYNETLRAGRELGIPRLDAVKRVRDLRTYQTVDAAPIRAADRGPEWTDARWAEFKADLRWFTRGAGKSFWPNVLLDRGYNASPTWHAIGHALTSELSIRSPAGRLILVLLDPALLLLAFALSVPAFGVARSAFVLFAAVSWFGNSGRILGQFWIYDWLAASWAAASLWRLGRPRWAGALAGYAAAVRIFPVLLLAGPVLLAGSALLRRRRPDPAVVRVLQGACAAMLLAFVAGSLASHRGPAMWLDFTERITHHSEEHTYGAKRVGLGHALSLDLRGGLAELPSKENNRAHVAENRPLQRALQLAAGLLFVLAVLRARSADLLLLGLPLLYFGTVASRYYGSIWVLLLLLGVARGGGRPDAPARADDARTSEPAPAGDARWFERPLARRLADAALFACGWLVFANPKEGEEGIRAYVLGNVALGAWLFGILAREALWGWGDEPARRSPEPGPPLRAPGIGRLGTSAPQEQPHARDDRQPHVDELPREDHLAEPEVEHRHRGDRAAED